MSVIHKVTFIVTICMARIFALSGIGQGFAPLYIVGDSFGVTNDGELSQLGDMYGHKKIFLIGAIWFGGWSLIAGFSVYSGSITFSIFRGFQAGAVLGGIFAAIFSQLVWWPWSYWVRGMILFAYTAMSFLILPRDKLESKKDGTKPIFDLAGTITGVSAGVVGCTVPYTLIVGVLFFGAFVYVEIHVAKHPLAPINMLSKELYYPWQLVENLRHHSVLSAAVRRIPVAPSGLVASLALGFFLSKVKVAYIMVAAIACFLTGQILIATAPVGQTYWAQTYWAQTFASLVIIPWGMDMSFPAGTIILSNGMPREHQGIAASLINTVVNYTISLSLGIAGTIIRQTNNGKENMLGSYRNAWYFAIGLDGLGMAIALWFFWISVVKAKTVS
ncbi:MFS general substrate transporter [Acephala macrosclerotiorum]|nr:MFS general substrate transporter [Acephala macrosclerotiorum]